MLNARVGFPPNRTRTQLLNVHDWTRPLGPPSKRIIGAPTSSTAGRCRSMLRRFRRTSCDARVSLNAGRMGSPCMTTCTHTEARSEGDHSCRHALNLFCRLNRTDLLCGK